MTCAGVFAKELLDAEYVARQVDLVTRASAAFAGGAETGKTVDGVSAAGGARALGELA